MEVNFSSAPPPLRLDGSNFTVGIVVARYNWVITGALLQMVQEELQCLKVARERTHVVYAPGSYELATVAQAMARTNRYDVLICLGCVMRGETRHDVVVSDAAAQGIQRVALDTHIPIICGVLCVQNMSQAEARIPRGREFAQAAIEMAQTMAMLSQAER